MKFYFHKKTDYGFGIFFEPGGKFLGWEFALNIWNRELWVVGKSR